MKVLRKTPVRYHTIRSTTECMTYSTDSRGTLIVAAMTVCDPGGYIDITSLV